MYIYIYMNRNFNSGHLFINPPGKRSVDSQPVKMKPKTRAMQGIWSWLGNRTSLKGKLCIETNGIADPCLFVFVCLFVWWFRIFSLSTNSKEIPPRYWFSSTDFDTIDDFRSGSTRLTWTKSSFYKNIQEPHFKVGGFSTHSLLISTFSH